MLKGSTFIPHPAAEGFQKMRVLRDYRARYSNLVELYRGLGFRVSFFRDYMTVNNGRQVSVFNVLSQRQVKQLDNTAQASPRQRWASFRLPPSTKSITNLFKG